MVNYAYDPSGNPAVQAVSALVAPQIVGQPGNQIAAPGDSATFSVVVADARATTFQWKFNGTDIPGATGDSLLLTNVSAANEGQYSVVVTNSAGSVTSAPATLMLDSNGDGLPDIWVEANFIDPDPTSPLNPANQRSESDPDKDGVSDLDEFLDGTDPKSNTSFRPRLTAYSDAGGSVTVAPMKLSYDLGETVTLTATPFAPSLFSWIGDLTGTSNPATLTMNGHKTVRARFAFASPIPPGLVAFWRGETDASDLVGGHDGTFFAGTSVTAPSITVSGKVSAAFNFDGTVHVRVPDSAALRPAQMTVEAWIFPTVDSNTDQTIIARGSSTTDKETWYLGISRVLPSFVLLHFRTFSPFDDLVVGPAIQLNQWTHVAASFDGTTKRVYINGVQAASQPVPGALVYDAAAVPVTIGSNWILNASSARFNGRVDEVAMYNRALTANEIVDIYNADLAGKNVMQPYFTSPSRLPDVVLGASYTQQVTTILGTAPVSFSLATGALPPGMTLSSAGVVSGVPGAPGFFDFTMLATDVAGISNEQVCLLRVIESVTAPAGLVGWWRAEGNALDSVGTNHGVLRGAAGFAGGKVGQAFLLDGTDACIEIPDAPALQPASLTLEAWVAFDVTSGFQALFAKPVGTGTSDSYALRLEEGRVFAAIGDASPFPVGIAAPFSPEPGSWHHLAHTFDHGTKQQALYVDGIQVAIQDLHSALTQTIGYDAQPVLLGRDTQNGKPSFFLQGRIDEASIYNRALSGAEIAAIFDAGPAGKRL